VWRALFLNLLLDEEIRDFGERLPDSHEEDFDFAGGEEDDGVGDHEGLRRDGQPGGDEGEMGWVRGILEMVSGVEGGSEGLT
jgi:hypothetical protein